jgi:HprK-related kinase A
MTAVLNRLADHARADIQAALAAGTAEMALGPFTMRLQATEPLLTDFLVDVYRDVPLRLSLDDVTDVSLRVRAPNLWRRYFRRQLIADPGFIVPAVPLPPRLSPLAFEMGLNLSIALKCCRYTTFHSAVVGNDKGAILISAQSGGGKSTLASALMMQGYRLFSDEFGLLDMATALLHGYPRPVSLKGQSIDIVREFTGGDWVGNRMTGTPKGDIAYRRPRPSDIDAAHIPAKAKLILLPIFEEGSAAHAKPISKAEAVMKLIPSSTNYHLLGTDAFEALIKMVNGANTFEITYGNTADSMAMVKDLAAGAGL